MFLQMMQSCWLHHSLTLNKDWMDGSEAVVLRWNVAAGVCPKRGFLIRWIVRWSTSCLCSDVEFRFTTPSNMLSLHQAGEFACSPCVPLSSPASLWVPPRPSGFPCVSLGSPRVSLGSPCVPLGSPLSSSFLHSPRHAVSGLG